MRYSIASLVAAMVILDVAPYPDDDGGSGCSRDTSHDTPAATIEKRATTSTSLDGEDQENNIQQQAGNNNEVFNH